MLDILFVDDDLYSMFTYVGVFKDAWFRVQPTSHADDALRHAAAHDLPAE